MDWRTLLLAFGVLWAVQIAGTALQMRHLRRFLRGLGARLSVGSIVSGNARARFGRGVIAVLVVSPSGLVRQAFAMQGRTVWATFKPLSSLEGAELGAIRSGRAFPPADQRLAEAFRRAVEQIDMTTRSHAH